MVELEAEQAVFDTEAEVGEGEDGGGARGGGGDQVDLDGGEGTDGMSEDSQGGGRG